MAKRYIESMIENAAEMFVEKGQTKEAERVLKKKKYTPIMNSVEIHPEQKSDNNSYNNIVSALVFDLDIINTEIANSAFEYDSLLKNSKERIEEIERELKIIRSKRRDIELLSCNNSIDIDPLDMEGDYSVVDNKICSKITSENHTIPKILSVDGNGREGNENVYIEEFKDYLHKYIDTSRRGNLTDLDELSIYEYARINVDTEEERAVPYFNIGWEEAKCCIRFEFESSVNSLKILATGNDIEITDIEISNDGFNFKSAKKESSFLGKDSSKEYEADYVSGSGIFCFPSSKYVNLYLQSIGHTDDIIAYDKFLLEEGDDV